MYMIDGINRFNVMIYMSMPLIKLNLMIEAQLLRNRNLKSVTFQANTLTNKRRRRRSKNRCTLNKHRIRIIQGAFLAVTFHSSFFLLSNNWVAILCQFLQVLARELLYNSDLGDNMNLNSLCFLQFLRKHVKMI